MYWRDAREYVEKLNRDKFAGHNDWRLPTLEESMSLMKPKRTHAALYIDPIFDKEQFWIWTADKVSASAAWVVVFSKGSCSHGDVGHGGRFVRAVRSGL
jgi:hypothetical protein